MHAHRCVPGTHPPDAADALRQPCVGPRQVEVDDGGRILEVDALAEAVRAHEDAPFLLAELVHPCLAILGRKETRHRLDAHVPERAPEMLGHVLRRFALTAARLAEGGHGVLGLQFFVGGQFGQVGIGLEGGQPLVQLHDHGVFGRHGGLGGQRQAQQAGQDLRTALHRRPSAPIWACRSAISA